MKYILSLGMILTLLSACDVEESEESDGAARVEEPSERINEVTENVEDTEEKSDLELAYEEKVRENEEHSRQLEETAREFLESKGIDPDEEPEDGVDPFGGDGKFLAYMGDVEVRAMSLDVSDDVGGEDSFEVYLGLNVYNPNPEGVDLPIGKSELTLNTGETAAASHVTLGLSYHVESFSEAEGIITYTFEDTEISDIEWADFYFELEELDRNNREENLVDDTFRLRF